MEKGTNDGNEYLSYHYRNPDLDASSAKNPNYDTTNHNFSKKRFYSNIKATTEVGRQKSPQAEPEHDSRSLQSSYKDSEDKSTSAIDINLRQDLVFQMPPLPHSQEMNSQSDQLKSEIDSREVRFHGDNLNQEGDENYFKHFSEIEGKNYQKNDEIDTKKTPLEFKYESSTTTLEELNKKYNLGLKSFDYSPVGDVIEEKHQETYLRSPTHSPSTKRDDYPKRSNKIDQNTENLRNEQNFLLLSNRSDQIDPKLSHSDDQVKVFESQEQDLIEFKHYRINANQSETLPQKMNQKINSGWVPSSQIKNFEATYSRKIFANLEFVKNRQKDQEPPNIGNGNTIAEEQSKASDNVSLSKNSENFAGDYQKSSYSYKNVFRNDKCQERKEPPKDFNGFDKENQRSLENTKNQFLEQTMKGGSNQSSNQAGFRLDYANQKNNDLHQKSHTRNNTSSFGNLHSTAAIPKLNKKEIQVDKRTEDIDQESANSIDHEIKEQFTRHERTEAKKVNQTLAEDDLKRCKSYANPSETWNLDKVEVLSDVSRARPSALHTEPITPVQKKFHAADDKISQRSNKEPSSSKNQLKYTKKRKYLEFLSKQKDRLDNEATTSRQNLRKGSYQRRGANSVNRSDFKKSTIPKNNFYQNPIHSKPSVPTPLPEVTPFSQNRSSVAFGDGFSSQIMQKMYNVQSINLEISKNLRYVGSVKNGKFHGQGQILTSKGETLFSGEFCEGRYSGFGKLYNYRKKLVVEGEGYLPSEVMTKFMSLSSNNYLKDIYGRRGLLDVNFSEENWDSYEGFFAEGKRHGVGKLWLCDGRVFEGEFIRGKAHGYGILSYFDKKVVGRWRNNVIECFL